jgi:FKBP-type peptidyl-prolyl cis-trans isomerase FklB
MKKVVLLLVCAFATIGAFAQDGSKKPKPKKSTESVAVAPAKVTPALPKLLTAKDSAAYASGIVLGNNLKRQIASSDLDKNLINDAAKAAISGDSLLFTPEQASKIEADYKKAQIRKAGEVNLKMGEEFLAKNKQRKEVTTTASGLQYEVMKAADPAGAMPKATNTVKVHYHGTNVDGSVFDSSVQRGQPIEFPLNGVIKGWTEGVQLMHVGDKFKFFIPQELAYGERSPSPKIKPFAALIFEVELIDITK